MLVTLRELMKDGDTLFVEHAVWKNGTYEPKLDDVVWSPDMLKLLQKVHVMKHEDGLYISRWFYPNNDGKYSFRIVVDK